jgi:hypothetical protein
VNRKITALVICLLLLGAFASAQSPKLRLKALQAKDHIGENATVCGKVVSSRYAAQSSGAPTFLNLDQPYPNQIFTIVIWGTNRPNFHDPEEYYRDQRVCVTGKIESYNGLPQIVARSPKQISRTVRASKAKRGRGP